MDPSIESMISKGLFSQNAEKTFVDKTLGKEDAAALREVVKKKELSREDLQVLSHLLTGTEQKLLNMNEHDRYLNGKFYTWIGDYISITGVLYDYLDDIREGNIKVDNETRTNLARTKKSLTHDLKFLVGVYLYLGRSTLSVSGVGFDTLTTQRFEYDYKQVGAPNIPEPEKRGLFRRN